MLLLIIALLLSLILLTSSSGLVQHTVQHSRELHVQLQEAARFAETFRSQRNRLPTDGELEAWAERHAETMSPPWIIPAGEGQFGEEAVDALGWPPSGGFILGTWRGEWMEYHASWTGESTMPLDDSGHYLFSSRTADILGSLSGIALCLAAAFLLWSDRGRRLLKVR